MSDRRGSALGRRVRPRLALVLFGAAAGLACGRLKEEATEGGGEMPAQDAGTQADARVDADTEAGADADADGADAGTAAPAPVLAVASQGEVVMVLADGSPRSFYPFGTALLYAPSSFSVGIAYRAGYLAVSGTSWSAAADGCALEGGELACLEADRVVLLDHSGSVLWDKVWSARVPSSRIGVGMRVGAGGYVVLTGSMGALLVAPDGDELRLPSVEPLAAPFPGPAVAVRAPPDATGATAFAWWRPGAAPVVTDPPFFVTTPLDALDTGDQLAFVATDAGGARVIVHAWPDHAEALPAVVPAGAASGSGSSSGAWRMIDEGADVVRFNLLTGVTERLPWSLPAGMRPLGGAIVGSDGSFARPLRDDSAAGVFVSPDAGASGWTRISQTLGQVEQVTLQETAGTYIIDALGTNDFFVAQQTWPAWPAGQAPELLQQSHELARPAGGAPAIQIFPRWYGVQLSRDGGRAAYFEATATSTRLVIHDLVTGTKTPSLEAGGAIRPQVLWLE